MDYDLGLPPVATTDLLDHYLSNYFQSSSRFCRKITPIYDVIAEAMQKRYKNISELIA